MQSLSLFTSDRLSHAHMIVSRVIMWSGVLLCFDRMYACALITSMSYAPITNIHALWSELCSCAPITCLACAPITCMSRAPITVIFTLRSQVFTHTDLMYVMRTDHKNICALITRIHTHWSEVRSDALITCVFALWSQKHLRSDQMCVMRSDRKCRLRSDQMFAMRSDRKIIHALIASYSRAPIAKILGTALIGSIRAHWSEVLQRSDRKYTMPPIVRIVAASAAHAPVIVGTSHASCIAAIGALSATGFLTVAPAVRKSLFLQFLHCSEEFSFK